MTFPGNPLYTSLGGQQAGGTGMTRKKTGRLLDCLSDVALEYARRVSTREGYEILRKLLKRRFSKKEEASSTRRQL